MNFYLGTGDGKIAFHDNFGIHFTLFQIKSGQCVVRVAEANPSIESEDRAIEMALKVKKCATLSIACKKLGI